MSFPHRIAACMFAILLAVPGLLAQTVTGSITGSVTDSGGAALPGAHVTAHNEDTGVDTSATTNGAGFYRIEFLPIKKLCARLRWKCCRWQPLTWRCRWAVRRPQ